MYYYLPPRIELPCYIRYADGTVRDLGDMCGVRRSPSTTSLPASTPAQSPGTRRDSDRDISEAMRIARGTPDFMVGLSTRERIEGYFGRPERSRPTSERLPDYVAPVIYEWTVRARYGTAIARIEVLFTNEDRVAFKPLIKWVQRN